MSYMVSSVVLSLVLTRLVPCVVSSYPVLSRLILVICVAGVEVSANYYIIV